jgi:hypothetical protein
VPPQRLRLDRHKDKRAGYYFYVSETRANKVNYCIVLYMSVLQQISHITSLTRGTPAKAEMDISEVVFHKLIT